MLRIRLSMGGVRKRPIYKIVIADGRYPRDGKFIEKIGSYNPLLPKDKKERIKIEAEEELKQGIFTMDSYLSQLRQMKKMGGMEGVMSMLPGVNKMKAKMDQANIDELSLIHI